MSIHILNRNMNKKERRVLQIIMDIKLNNKFYTEMKTLCWSFFKKGHCNQKQHHDEFNLAFNFEFRNLACF